MSKKKTKQLTISKQKELDKWQEKTKSGKAEKETKNYLLSDVIYGFDPRHNLTIITKDIMPKLIASNNNIKKLSEEEIERINQFSIDYGMDNNLSIAEAIEPRYRGLIVNLKKDLMKEYDCKNCSEKALVDLMANAYARNISASKWLVNTMAMGHTTPNLNNFISVLSKEIDRANRHFTTSLEILRQIKQPELKINVKAKNAFISQNQQINSLNRKDEKNQEEIINP